MSNECYIAVDANRQAWGRGETIKAARRALFRAGGRAITDLRHISGDDTAYVNDMGDLMAAPGATAEKIKG